MTTSSETRTAEHTAHDYASVTAEQRDEALVRDVYADFGWSVERAQPARLRGGPIVLRLRRERALKNRSLVNELQRTAEVALGEVRGLERSQTRRPGLVSWTVGLVGAALLAGSVFAMTAGLILAMVLLGTAGLLLWCLTYPINRLLRRARRRATVPRIERQRDIVEDCGRRARALLA